MNTKWDTMPCLRKQNENTDMGRYGTENFLSIAKMQTGKFDWSKRFMSNRHQRAGRIDSEPMNL